VCCSSETSADLHRNIRRYIAEDKLFTATAVRSSYLTKLYSIQVHTQLVYVIAKEPFLCKFPNFHGGYSSNCDLICCDTIQFCRWTPIFRANMLPPSSGSTVKNEAARSSIPFQIVVTHFMPLAYYSGRRTSAQACDEIHFHGCQM
jgi:hypothetical protein